MADEVRTILSNGLANSVEWHEWMKAAGIVGADDKAYHVIIELKVGKPVTIYVAKKGTTQMLTVAPPSVMIGEDGP